MGELLPYLKDFVILRSYKYLYLRVIGRCQLFSNPHQNYFCNIYQLIYLLNVQAARSSAELGGLAEPPPSTEQAGRTVKPILEYRSSPDVQDQVN